MSLGSAGDAKIMVPPGAPAACGPSLELQAEMTATAATNEQDLRMRACLRTLVRSWFGQQRAEREITAATSTHHLNIGRRAPPSGHAKARRSRAHRVSPRLRVQSHRSTLRRHRRQLVRRPKRSGERCRRRDRALAADRETWRARSDRRRRRWTHVATTHRRRATGRFPQAFGRRRSARRPKVHRSRASCPGAGAARPGVAATAATPMAMLARTSKALIRMIRFARGRRRRRPEPVTL